jgi:hypothetical protein
LALLTLGAVSYHLPKGRVLRAGLALFAVLFVLVRIDAMIFRLLMREEPLLYDQLFMLRHLMVLMGDLWSPTALAITAGVCALLVLIPWLVMRLLERVRELLSEARLPKTVRVALLLWPVVLVASASHALGLTEKPLVQWMTPALADNLARSHATYSSLQKNLQASPYAPLSALKLAQRPDVLLFLVESYGRLLFEHGRTHDAIRRRLDADEATLTARGWHSVSGFTTAPVSGGRSWMAEGALIMGTPVHYEAAFHHLIANVPKMVTLTSFLEGQGYRSINVAAADRKRPGIDVVNYYGFDEGVHFDEVRYKGRAFGWGIVPDQFTLGFVAEEILAKHEGPVFVDMHLVTSHAPWREVPELVADFRGLSTGDAQPKETETKAAHTIVGRRLKRYAHLGEGRDAYMGRLTGELLEGYERAIHYELDVLVDYLSRRERDALVIIVGDHQPPVIAEENASFDTPIHLLSRNADTTRHLLSLGFRSGMQPEGDAVMHHAGLLSLVAHTLAIAAGQVDEAPRWVPQGHVLIDP